MEINEVLFFLLYFLGCCGFCVLVAIIYRLY
jgi:hypothetical protein